MNQKSKWAILSGVILAMLLSSLDQTIVSTAMPTIVRELQGLEHISWVFTAYMLGSTVTVPIYGKLSDMFGRRNLYLLGIGIFLAGSVLCGFAQDMTQLIIFRGIQGIGGGAIMVNSFAIIGDVFPPAERGKYQGMIGGVFGLSSIAGPLLGGWITDNTSWRWVFFVNIPLGILAIGVLAGALPKIIAYSRNKKIDWWGALFILTTLVPLLLSLVWGGSIYEWSSWPIIVSLSISIVSLFIFIRIEQKTSNPILSLDLFRNRIFLTSVCAMFLTAIGMFGTILYVPIFSQGVIGGSATHAGLILTPLMIALITASTISGQIISRTGKYKILAVSGTLIIVGGLFFFATIDTNTTNAELILRMIILGIGLGSTMPIFTLAVQSAFSKQRLGEVTAGTQLFRSVGGTVGTAVLGGIMNTSLEAHNINNLQNHFNASAKIAFADAVDTVFMVAAFIMIVAFIIVLFLPEIPLRKSERPAMEEAGVILEDELGQSDDESQPRLETNKSKKLL